MPWKVIHKTYGRDHRVDATYHIRYQSSNLSFDIICSYHNESYRWVLSSRTFGLEGIILGESPKMTDREAAPAAIAYIRGVHPGERGDLEQAEDSFRSQILKDKIQL